jgi:eukaryotic-like serine/threonine-protein kinase
VHPGSAPLDGRYALDELLATGGMGQVWRGRDLTLHRPVAVKVLRSEYTGDPTFLARFRAEAKHAALLGHPNIAAVFDYGEVPAADVGEHLAYLVMELVDGEPLSDLLAREPRLEVAPTLDIVGQTAAALAAAHAAGVVHRDVKPGNVLLRGDGRVAITDFGIAWSASSVPLTRTGQVVGTAHYFSPEQARGLRAGPGSDVYALGLIAYECLAGRRAFDGDNAVEIALRQISDAPDLLPDDVPPAVRSLVGRALLKDPDERFADGAALLDAVDRVRSGRRPDGSPATRSGAVVWPEPQPSPGAATAHRGRRLLVHGAALLAGAGIAIAGVSVLGSAAPPPAASSTGTTEVPADAVVVVAADHVGRDVDEVESALAALGLRVERVAQPSSSAPAGQVLDVTPTGALRTGDLVTVTYAVAPAAPRTTGTPDADVDTVVTLGGADGSSSAGPTAGPSDSSGGSGNGSPDAVGEDSSGSGSGGGSGGGSGESPDGGSGGGNGDAGGSGAANGNDGGNGNGNGNGNAGGNGNGGGNAGGNGNGGGNGRGRGG